MNVGSYRDHFQVAAGKLRHPNQKAGWLECDLVIQYGETNLWIILLLFTTTNVISALVTSR